MNLNKTSYDLNEIVKFQDFVKENEKHNFEESVIIENLDLIKNNISYQKAFFTAHLKSYYAIYKFLKICHENDLKEELKQYIDNNIEDDSVIEILLCYYLFLYATKDKFKDTIKDELIKQLSNGKKVSYYFVYELYLFCILNSLNMQNYKNIIIEDNRSSNNETNILNDLTKKKLFLNAEEITKYSRDDKIILSINKNDIVKFKNKNLNLFIVNTATLLNSCVYSSSDIIFKQNVDFLKKLIDWKNIDLEEIYNLIGSSIVSFFCDKSFNSLDNLEVDTISIENNNILYDEAKIDLLENIFKEKNFNEYNLTRTISKLYTDILYINKLLDYELPNKDIYPSLNKLFKHMFFLSMMENHFTEQNNVFFRNKIHFPTTRNRESSPSDFILNHFYVKKDNYFTLEDYDKTTKKDMNLNCLLGALDNLNDSMYSQKAKENSKKLTGKLLKNIKEEFNVLEELKTLLKEEIKSFDSKNKYFNPIKINLNINSMTELKEYSEENKLLFDFYKLLNCLNYEEFNEKFLNVDYVLKNYIGKVFKTYSDNRLYETNYIEKFSKLENVVNYLFKQIINENKINKTYLNQMLKFHYNIILKNENFKDFLLIEKDLILSLDVKKIKFLKFYNDNDLLNENEKVLYNDLNFRSFIDNNREDNTSIDNLDEKLKILQPLKEFSLRLKNYLNKENEVLYKNKYIFKLLKNNYIEILSDKYVVEKLVKDDSWHEVDKTIFLKDLIKEEKCFDLFNLIKELAVFHSIKLSDSIKTEFFYTNETLDDIF